MLSKGSASRRWTVTIIVALSGCASAPVTQGPSVDAEYRQLTEAATLSLQQGSLEQAAELYDEALARARLIDTANEIDRAAYNLGVVLTMLGRHAMVASLLDTLDHGAMDDALEASLTLLRARNHYYRGAPETAVSVLEDISRSPATVMDDGQRMEAALLLGEIACEDDRLEFARMQLQVAQLLQPGLPANPGLERLRGSILAKEGDFARAAAAHEREAQTYRSYGLYRSMASALMRAGDHYASLGDFRNAFDLHYRAGFSFFEQSRFLAAHDALQRAEASAEATADPRLRERAAALRNRLKAHASSTP